MSVILIFFLECFLIIFGFFKDLFLFTVRICSQCVQVPRSPEVGIISLELEFTGP